MTLEGQFDSHLASIAALPSVEPETPTCKICGEPSYSPVCITCEEQEEKDRRENDFQRALNAMDAGFVTTFNLLVATYYEGLADKKDCGENIALLIHFANEAIKEKSKQIHS